LLALLIVLETYINQRLSIVCELMLSAAEI